MKVANLSKLKAPNKHIAAPDPAPPDREAEERMNNQTPVEGKGSISFLLPITMDTEHQDNASKPPRKQQTSKILQKRVSRKTNRKN